MAADENHDEPGDDMERLLGLVRAQQYGSDLDAETPFASFTRDELVTGPDQAEADRTGGEDQ